METKVKLADKLASGYDVTIKDETGRVTTHNFDTKSQGLAWLSKQKNIEVISEKAEGIETATQHSIEITPELKAAVEKGQPLFKESEDENNFGGFTTRDDKPIGYTYDTDKVARERFDFSNLKKIGSGSDRDVYDLGNGKVLKVAKTARGLTQNIYEGDTYLSMLPKAHERGLNYVVVDNIPPAKSADVIKTYDWDGNVTGDATIGQMLNELSKFNQRDFNNHNGELQDVLAKYGLQDVMSYDVLWNDFTAKRNWGYKNGEAYHSDGGTFGGVDMIDSYKNKTNLSDPEFREIYNKSKQLKKQFGDTDKATMYSKSGGEIEAQYRIESGKNIIEAIKDFDGSPRATVALTHEIMHPTVVSIIDGAKEGNETGARHANTIVEEYNKATGKNITQEQLIEGNDKFKEAVAQGTERIAWTTGEQQNERYDLSKQVDEIGWQKNENEWESELTKDEVNEEGKLLDARENTKGGTIQQAPFVTDTNAWTKLGLKRIIGIIHRIDGSSPHKRIIGINIINTDKTRTRRRIQHNTRIRRRRLQLHIRGRPKRQNNRRTALLRPRKTRRKIIMPLTTTQNDIIRHVIRTIS